MKYLINNTIKKPDHWIVFLHYWEGSCYCAHKEVKLKMYQDTKPTLEEAKEAFNL